MWRSGELFHHVHQAGQAGHPLGEHSGQRGSRHPQPEHQDKGQVQADVQHRGHGQEIDGRLAVSQGPDDGRQQVIKEGGGDAHEDDEDVPVGPLIDVRRGIHDGENGTAQQTGGHGEYRGKRDGQPGGVGHIPAHLAIISRAHTLGHRDGKAVAHAHTKADDKEVDGAGGAYRRQGGGAQQLAHDHGVHHIVQLLEQHAQQGGQRKAQNEPHGAAGGQVLGHTRSLLGQSPQGGFGFRTIIAIPHRPEQMKFFLKFCPLAPGANGQF